MEKKNRIDEFLQLLHESGGSDLHIAANKTPAIRLHGEVHLIDHPPMKDADLRVMLYEIASNDRLLQFQDTGDVDFGYSIVGVARYRVNLFEQIYGIGAVFREISNNIMTLEQLNLPPVLKRFAMMDKGLVLVTGPTGSGKSTTLAAIVDYANKNRRDHILTIEDPVEYVHKSQNCIVNHREVGTHTKSFNAALRGALREDPDIILVGEMRDLETIALALEAATTGHLVFGTLHTQSAPKTIDRIIDVFPPDQQEKIRVTLSEALAGVVAQSLLQRCDKPGRVACQEILLINNAARSLIRDGKTFQLYSVIQTGKREGMQLLDDALESVLKKGWIDRQAAFDAAVEKTVLRR